MTTTTAPATATAPLSEMSKKMSNLTATEVNAEMVEAHRQTLANNSGTATTAYYAKRGDDSAEREAMNYADQQFSRFRQMTDEEKREEVAKVVSAEITEPTPAEPIILENQPESQADAINRLERELSHAKADSESWRERLNQAMTGQVHGDDPRLSDFWELAGDKANSAGFCEQYDILAEALGGPTRTVSYTVEHELTISVTVSAYSMQSAGRNATSSDFESFEDSGYDDDIDYRIKEAIDCGNYTVNSSSIESWEESE